MSWLTDGKGTPWGPMDYGKPDTPDFITNPMDARVPQFKDSQLFQAMRRRNARQTQGANQALLGQYGKLGVQGADAVRALGGVSAENTENALENDANLAKYGWESSKSLMDAINNRMLQKYGIDSENFNNEQQGRAGFMSALGSLAGQVGGTLLGGKMFGAGGAAKGAGLPPWSSKALAPLSFG